MVFGRDFCAPLTHVLLIYLLISFLFFPFLFSTDTRRVKGIWTRFCFQYFTREKRLVIAMDATTQTQTQTPRVPLSSLNPNNASSPTKKRMLQSPFESQTKMMQTRTPPETGVKKRALSGIGTVDSSPTASRAVAEEERVVKKARLSVCPSPPFHNFPVVDRRSTPHHRPHQQGQRRRCFPARTTTTTSSSSRRVRGMSRWLPPFLIQHLHQHRHRHRYRHRYRCRGGV